MKTNIHGNKLEITESIKSYIIEKLGKLDKYFENPEELTATISLKVRGKEQIVEITIPIKKAILRCEESNGDLYASIDFAVDKLERQIRKNKTKMKKNKEKYIEIKELDISRHTLIVMIRRGDNAIVPNGDTLIKSGDIVFVFSKRYMADAQTISV